MRLVTLAFWHGTAVGELAVTAIDGSCLSRIGEPDVRHAAEPITAAILNTLQERTP
jgi:hypothetical protein